MPQLRKIHMPDMTLELDPDVVIMAQISSQLNKASLDATAMLYCGVDAAGLEKARTLPPRPETFAASYDSMMRYAEQYDRIYDFINTYPLAFVRMASRLEDAVPALVAYDASQLVQPERADWLYVPKTGNNVQKAARAILFFS